MYENDVSRLELNIFQGSNVETKDFVSKKTKSFGFFSEIKNGKYHFNNYGM